MNLIAEGNFFGDDVTVIVLIAYQHIKIGGRMTVASSR